VDAKRISSFRITFWGLLESLYLLIPWIPVLRLDLSRKLRPQKLRSSQITDPGEEVRLAWFLDVSSPELKRDAGSRRLLEVMRSFQEKGFFIIFSSLNGDRLSRESIEFLAPTFMDMPFELARGLLLKDHSRFSVVWCSRLVGARFARPLIKSKAKDTKFVFDTVDIHGTRIASYGQGAFEAIFRLLGNQIRRQELGLARRFDVTVAVSEEEQSWLRSEGIQAALVPTIFESTPNPIDWETRTGQFFVANFNHVPNVQGLSWYLSEVWPLLSLEVRSQGLKIIGANVPKFLLSHASTEIQFLGRVERIESVLQKSRVAIAPIISGAGVNGKIVEAMSAGVATATTPLGAGGVGLNHNVDCLVGGNPKEFAAAVEILCSDKITNLEISRAAELVAVERFSRASLSQRLDNLMA